MAQGEVPALTPESLDDSWHFAAFVDCETTGLDPAKHELIELALVLFAYDPVTGEVKGVVDEYVGFQEPRGRIHAASRKKHGITRNMVRGKQLDVEKVNSILRQAGFLVAHNSQFDRAFVAPLFPLARKKRWYCSLSNIDWRAKGFSSRSLHDLQDQHGIRSDGAHRALDDARAGVILLAQKNRDGHIYMSELLRGRETQEKFKQAEEKTQSIGCALTLLIAIPIVGVVFFGILGLIGGIIISALGLAGMFMSRKK